MNVEHAIQLLVSLGLGMLVGLQRERTTRGIGGIRTFPLITLLGTIAAQIGGALGGWLLGAGAIAIAALLVFANIARWREGERASGLTTEIAALLLYALGAYVVVGPLFLAVAAGGAIALLLHWKPQLHRFAGAVGDEDMRAIMQFVLVSLVILPVLPRATFGPFDVLSLFEIWLMVVLIVGISLAGYVVHKLVGPRSGTVLAGVLGGVISSTATTVSYARRSREAADRPGLLTLVVMIAAAVSIARVLFEIAAVAPRSFAALAPPLAAMLIAMLAVTAFALRSLGDGAAERPEPRNPATMRVAIAFALVYALVKLAVAAMRERAGEPGLYVVGVVSGFTDMDAITLSTARLVDAGRLETGAGWRTILVAAMANLVFKGAAVAVLGRPELARRVAVRFGACLAAGAAILTLWPA